MSGTNSMESRGVATTQVSFICQKCSQPLKLDPSFSSLDAQTYVDLTAPLLTEKSGSGNQSVDNVDTFDVNKEDGVPRKEINAPNTSSQDSGQDFLLIGETSGSRMESLSHRLKVSSQLFDIMSGHTDIDHPLCMECTNTLLDQLDHQLKITEDECKLYKESLDKLNNQRIDEKDEENLQIELEKLRLEEAKLIKQLHEIEDDRKEIAEESKRYQGEIERIEVEEEKYWKEYTSYKQQLLDFQDEQRSVENQLKYAQTQLDRLHKTNVFNATFHIWHNGHFGTINGFRLGRLPTVHVEWNEINAAWGQTVLLLFSLAEKMKFKFKRYKLVPLGNHSYVESIDDKSKQLPLYGTGGFRFFWDTKFDQAMAAFLDCLQQLEQEVLRGDSSFCLPYKMANGKIEDPSTNQSYSIKIQFNSEEQWTKALKFMLTNLKWALAWVSAQFSK